MDHSFSPLNLQMTTLEFDEFKECIARVALDISPKPPATTEWE